MEHDILQYLTLIWNLNHKLPKCIHLKAAFHTNIMHSYCVVGTISFYIENEVSYTITADSPVATR